MKPGDLVRVTSGGGTIINTMAKVIEIYPHDGELGFRILTGGPFRESIWFQRELSHIEPLKDIENLKDFLS